MANTWESELIKELKTQPQTNDLNTLMLSLDKHTISFEDTAAELHRQGLNYFGSKVAEQFYHIRAKDQDKADEQTKEGK